MKVGFKMKKELQDTYVALHLIEGLFKQELISLTEYKAILADYSKQLDVSEFFARITDKKEKTKVKGAA